jgi:hypothetical protein
MFKAELLLLAALGSMASPGPAAPAPPFPLLADEEESHLFEDSPFGFVLGQDRFAKLALRDPVSQEDLTVSATLDEGDVPRVEAKAGRHHAVWKPAGDGSAPGSLLEAFPELKAYFQDHPWMKEAAVLFLNDLQFRKALDIWSGEPLHRAIFLARVTHFLPRFPLTGEEVVENYRMGLDPNLAWVVQTVRKAKEGPEMERLQRALRLAGIPCRPASLANPSKGVTFCAPYVMDARAKAALEALQADSQEKGDLAGSAWAHWEQGCSPAEINY